MRAPKQFVAFLIISIIFCSSAVAAASSQDKMTPEELVARHLASIGPADALSSARTRIAVGNAQALSYSRAVREIRGVGQFASDGNKVLLAMVFDLIDYPYEKAGYDGRKMTVALLEGTGARTVLGDFLLSQDSVFKHGLIGGALSSAWPLLDIPSNKPKLTYSGKEKINGQEVHKLKYGPPKGSGDFQINLFFDAETFRHVRTEYSFIISARMGPRPSGIVLDPTTGTGSQSLIRYKLSEEFSDFKTEGRLTLPHTYKIRLTRDTPTLLSEWVINFSQFVFNEPIDASAFNVSSSK